MSRCKIIQNPDIVETVGKGSKPNGDLLLRAKAVSALVRAVRQCRHSSASSALVGHSCNEFNMVALVQLKNKAVYLVAHKTCP